MVNVDFGKMGSTSETSSHSFKYAPLGVADLMKDILVLQSKSAGTSDSANSSYSSHDSSADSITEAGLTKTKPCNNVKSDSTSDKVKLLPDKENIGTNRPIKRDTAIGNQLSKAKINEKSNIKSVVPFVSGRFETNCKASSENKQVILSNVTNRSTSKFINTIANSLSENKLRSANKIVCSSQKLKTVTPNVKVGIKRYTPVHSSRSARRLRQLSPRESPVCPAGTRSAKCLFPEWQGMGAPDTPMQKEPAQVISATPSQPQGLPGVRQNFKVISVKGKRYVVIKKVGSGGSSGVFKVLEVSGTREFAVKVVGLQGVESSVRQGYINEIRLLKSLQDSDRVVAMHNYEYCPSSQTLRVVLELGETDLASVLRSRVGVPTQPLTLLLHYWIEMLAAVNYIHQNEIIHADLKPANFLLVGGRLKLIDFGIAARVESDATSVQRSGAQGTFSYISPEALEGGAGGANGAFGDKAPIKISYRSDVWSLGCILYSMVYGRTPFGHITNLCARIATIINPNHQIAYPDASHVPYTISRALRQCLRYTARTRPTVAELLALPYCPAAPPPATHALLGRLRAHVSADEWRLLQDTCGLPPMLPCDAEGMD